MSVQLHEIQDKLILCTETYKVFWKPRHDGNRYLQWNARFANKEAGTLDEVSDTKGLKYKKLQITILGKRVKIANHIAVWALFYGKMPEGEIDHIDGDGLNNNISNLRCVIRQENSKNRRIYRNNKTGVSGVAHCNGRLRAKIRNKGKDVHLGYFDSIIDAKAAIESARKEFGYHLNHGQKRGVNRA